MNLVGKIFTGLIAFFCIIFMSLVLAVYSAHTNWKIAAQTLKTQLDTANKDKQDLTDKLKALTDAYATEKNDLGNRLAASKTEADNLRKDRDNLKTQHDELNKKEREMAEALRVTHLTADSLRKEVDQLRTKIREVQKDHDEAFAAMVEATDKLHQAVGQWTSLKRTYDVITADLAEAKDVLKLHNLSPKMGDHTKVPPAELFAKVLSNPTSEGLVEISVGSDDNVRQGHQLEVFRASRYLGRIQVITTDKDRAVARVLPEFRRGLIQKGDDVTSNVRNLASRTN